ncbi:16210_t:CDS:2, partial [Dentiscutata heterogama]
SLLLHFDAILHDVWLFRFKVYWFSIKGEHGWDYSMGTRRYIKKDTCKTLGSIGLKRQNKLSLEDYYSLLLSEAHKNQKEEMLSLYLTGGLG